MALVTLPRQLVVDANGTPRVGAKLYVYDAGTTTPHPAYTTPSLGIAHSSPIESLSTGLFPAVYVDPDDGDYKLVCLDADDVPLWTEDDIHPDGVTQAIIGEALYPRTAAETTAGVTPTNYAFPPYSRSRYSTWTEWTSATNQADAEGILDADFAITSNVVLPRKCDFRGYQITGSYFTTHQQYQAGWVKNWEATKPKVSGCYFCQYTGVRGVDILIDGYGSGYGTFWCDMQISEAESLTLDMTLAPINQNHFRDGLCRYVHLTGNASTMPSTQIHGNLFSNLDVSNNGLTNYGIVQDDTKNERNFISNCYYENGSDIRGNFHITGFQGDANSPPRVDRFNHVIGSIGINQLNRADFFSLSTRNLVRGGCWDWLKSDGVPSGFSNSGGASEAVVADTTEPCGIGKRYECQFADALDQFTITLQPCGVDRAAVTIFYKSTADFELIETNDGTGAVYHNADRYVDLGGNWKMIRLSVPTSKTATTPINLYAYGGTGGATKTMSLGGVFASPGNGGIPPYKNDEYSSGQYTPTGTSVANVDSATPSVAQWMKVNGMVHVTGEIAIDPTSTSTLTRLGLSLPFAPSASFSASSQCAGTVAASAYTEVGRVYADTSNNRAEIGFIAVNNSSHTMSYSYSYRY